MKLLSLRTGLVALAFSSLLSFPSAATAETAEARGAIMVRDHAATTGKVVDRLAAGAKLTVIEFSSDGGWVRVKTKGGHEGWVPVASVRTKGGVVPAGEPSATASATDPPAAEDDALAKRRNVRGEAWVSKSKYHEEDNKMTVVAAKAELYGRPVAAGTVLGLVRRGEVVQFIRKSSDKKWVQIDIGAGELAWVDARAVRMGADMGDEPRQPEERDTRRGDPPPPASKRHADQPSPADLRRADDRDERDRRDRDDRDRADRDRADRDRRDRDDRDRRDRDDRDRRERDDRRRRRDDERNRGPKHGPNYIDASINVGFGKVGDTVRTNGTTTNYIANYKQLTTGLAIGAQLGYARAFGKLRLHLDFKYVVVALGSVVYTGTDGTSTRLQILDENIGGGVTVGGHFDPAGGIDVGLRIGVDSWVNQLSPSNPPLSISQNVLLGMAIGAELAMLQPIHVANRPLGFRLRLGAIAPATRIQQGNLLTAPHNTTVGGYFGAGVFFGLIDNPHKGQLHIQLSYDFSFAFSHFTGECKATTLIARQCRDDTVDDAHYASAQHVGTLGLYYQY